MKAISLLQPWATLVVIGAKKIETRSWDTKHRGDLLIHASRKMYAFQKHLCEKEPFSIFLKDIDQLPLGSIIGKVTLSDTAQIAQIPGMNIEGVKWPYELNFGDYSAGRYGWILKDAVSFTNHIPYNGSLGLWNYNDRICFKCGCTYINCRACIEKTGHPCHWVGDNLCSACSSNDTSIESLKTFNSSIKNHFKTIN